jgi:hypothetical protein
LTNRNKNSIIESKIRKGIDNMKCKDCFYWWQDEDDDFPQCHCPEDIPVAPCEYNDITEEGG